MSSSVPYCRIIAGSVVPMLLYALGEKLGMTLAGAVCASAWCLLVMAVVYWRLRVWDAFSTMGAVYAVAELTTVLLTHNPEWYLFSPIVFGGCFGLFFFISVAVRRPLLRYFAEQTVGVDTFPEHIRASRHYVIAWDRITCVWAAAYLLKAGVLALFLAWTPLGIYFSARIALDWPLTMGLVLFSFWYPRHYWESVFTPVTAE